MIKNSKYKAFTLVEMLIVMGILSVLMAIGVSVARFAIQRANNIQHQNAVDQLFQAFQSYYADNRSYPGAPYTNHRFDDFYYALNGGILSKYIDANFDGGSPAVYYYTYTPTSTPQGFLVCVSFADIDANSVTENAGGYCNGNGFGMELESFTNKRIVKKTFEPGTSECGSCTAIDYTWSDIVEELENLGSRTYWDGRDWVQNPS